MTKSKTQNQKISQTIVSDSSIPKYDVWKWLSITLILVSTYILYLPATNHDFVNWDDQVYVETNDLVLQKKYKELSITPISLNYHPVTMISLAMQVPDDVTSLKAGLFIHFNIIIHLISTLLLFLFIDRLTKDRWIVAVFVSAIFALHPMHVESVAWVSERKDVLYVMFFFSACLSYLLYKQKGKAIFFVLTMLFFIMSVLSKAMGVVLPLVLLLIDYWQGDDMTSWKTYRRHLFFFAVSLLFGFMAINVQSGGNFYGILDMPLEKSKAAVASFSTFSVWKRLLIASYGFIHYIIGFFAPFRISAFYPYPPNYEFSVGASIGYPVLAALVFGLGFWCYHKQKAVFWGLAFYFSTIALVLQFLSVGTALLADRYTYLPFVGISFALASVVFDWVKNKSKNLRFLPLVAASVFIIGLTLKTKSQVGVWKNGEQLWSQVLKYHPKEDLALANRGNYRGKTGNIDGAVQDFELAISDGCNRADVYEGLGIAYGTLSGRKPGRKDEYVAKAKNSFLKAIEIDSTNSNYYYNFGVSQISVDIDTALALLSKALNMAKHKEKQILPLITMCQINSGKYDQALTSANRCLALGLNSAEMFYFRGLAYMGLGKFSMASQDLKQALVIDPKHPDAGQKLRQIQESY
jgi:tetratricopeptide (TPR) repeat protein